MPLNLRGRSLLTLKHFSSDEIDALLSSAQRAKEMKRGGIYPRRLQNKNIALVFLKPSCRTRAAFVVAAVDEGAHAENLPADDIRFGVKESVRDVARVLGRMFDGIAFRGHEHELIAEFAHYAGVPVWNALCERYHPTQALADLLTLRERWGSERGLPVTYVGDGRNNVTRSLMIAAVKMGMDLRILAPAELQPEKGEIAELMGQRSYDAAKITATDDADRAMDGAAAVYSDVWVSMGEEHLIDKRLTLLRDYKVTPALMAKTRRSDTIYMHCLPAFHDDSTEYARKYPGVQEVDDAVFESPRSVVFDQAENRMHTIKAVMVATL